jgi:hypothetical protein
MRHLALLAATLLIAAGAARAAENATTPGQLLLQEPTLICLGFEWHIAGDDNADCRVEVDYRAKGRVAWRKALPLFRVENVAYRNQYPAGDRANGGKPYFKHVREPVPFGNKLAGSLFDLTPDTEYEVRLALKDPDGGEETRVVVARTRAEPQPAAGGRTLHVLPGDGGGDGTGADPFKGLAAALEAAQPGDTVLLRPGSYAPARFPRDGVAGKPITLRGADPERCVIDGPGPAKADKSQDVALDLRGRSQIIIERLTVRNAAWGVRMERGADLTVRRCNLIDCDVAVAAWARESRGKRFLVCDNRILARKGPGMGLGPGAAGDVIGDEGVVLTGDGHVVCHNYIRGFSDGLSFGSVDIDAQGLADYGPNTSLDVYGNDILDCLDDGLELDWGRSNVRVFRNRVTNALKGLSCQPVFGGPIYVIRNLLVNNQSTFKFHCEPSGMLLYHNTAFSSAGWTGGDWHRGVTRNNIFTARFGQVIRTNGRNVDMDYDGLLMPETLTRSVAIAVGGKGGKTLEEFQAVSGLEKRAVQLTLADFAAPGLQLPASDYDKKEFPFYKPGEHDLALNPLGKAVDAGEPLPNINDDFAGKAPDLGALEVGRPPLRFGPRD